MQKARGTQGYKEFFLKLKCLKNHHLAIAPNTNRLREKKHNIGRKDGSAVKSTCCFCRGPRFNTQHPRGISQPTVIPVPGAPKPSSVFHGQQARIMHRDHVRKTPKYIK